MDSTMHHQLAVVLGAATVGLLAARVLPECYGSVPFIGRDWLSEQTGNRKRVPQRPHVLIDRSSRVTNLIDPSAQLQDPAPMRPIATGNPRALFAQMRNRAVRAFVAGTRRQPVASA
jgi:hypothetical protein